jgi:hypothetical protein
MANQEKESDKIKTLEMRIAALEDKLSGMNVTEEEMRAYEKVSALMGGGGGGGGQQDVSGDIPQPGIVCQISRIPRFISRIPRIRFCNECFCGPCACDIGGGGGIGGGGASGGGFGGFGY